MNEIVNKLISSYKLISNQIDEKSLAVVLEGLDKVLNIDVEGDVVELGCYIGTTSLFIRRLLDSVSSPKQFHVYDSFEGLPEKHDQDKGIVGAQFKAGELKVSKKDLLKEFKKAGLKPPTVHKGWFENLSSNDLPDKIAFAFLDGDFYESILISLYLTWPRLSKGSILCIDDYKREALPGVEKAVTQFFGADEGVIKRANIGVIIKL